MKVISLFSGAGGLDLGLVQSGHTIVWANDNDIDACETYRNNIGNHIICNDIESINLNTIPDADVIVGGFPCQGFSMANKSRSIDDERNKLYKYFVKVVSTKKPKYFLAENVRGILSLEKGEAIKAIVNDFEKIGYIVQYQLFNMANYGVPQTRQRVIIAGTRKDVNNTFTFPQPTHTKDDWINIAEALSGIPEPSGENDTIPNHIYSKYKITNRNFTGHRRTDPQKPSPTILARGNGKGGVCAIQHPNNHRRMSVRESSIIQTFPLSFVFSGKMNSMYRQVGNAVPVLFAKHLGIQLMECEQ
ncbi:MAG: DNA cytosine methyltransferase [Opitutaceae bacterium]|nr:DNA cytosine methyltransferase [Opitutaceae bacterium]